MELPSYRDLPVAPDGGRSAWGLFGPDDNVGLLNLQTPARIAAAALLIRTGKCFSLNAGLEAFRPTVAATRGIPRHHVVHSPLAVTVDDVYDNFYPQASSRSRIARPRRVHQRRLLQRRDPSNVVARSATPSSTGHAAVSPGARSCLTWSAPSPAGSVPMIPDEHRLLRRGVSLRASGQACSSRPATYCSCTPGSRAGT